MGAVKKARISARRAGSAKAHSAPPQATRPRSPVLVPAILILVLGTGAAYRLFLYSPGLAWHPTNAHLTHDPSASRRPAPVYEEKLDGDTYVNGDLKIALTAPSGWEAAIGGRDSRSLSYEGLLLKATKGKPSPEKPFPPLISVVCREVGSGQPNEPLGYIRSVLLTDGSKLVEEGPDLVEVNGRKVGFVRYTLATKDRHLTIAQYVVVQGSTVYTFTGASAKEGPEDCRRDLERVIRSFRPLS